MCYALRRWLARWGVLTPALVALITCPLSLLVSQSPAGPGPDQARLQVDINYSGTWYIETFGYTRQAPNIRHYLLVVPEQEASALGPGTVFTSIGFPLTPQEPPSLREDRQEYTWMLPYLYQAPAGYFSGEFASGTYRIAAAFIAAPLNPAEAGVDDSAMLYAGVTGGGASSDYREVDLVAGQTTKITITLTDSNGWACPWLYVYDGQHFVRRTEILRNIVGQDNQQREVSDIGPVDVFGGSLLLQLAEERQEVSYIDEFYLLVDGIRLDAAGPSVVVESMRAIDGHYLVMAQGESHTLRFELPEALADRAQVAVRVVASGYYAPLE